MNAPLRILHVIPSVAAGTGGTATALFTMADMLRDADCIVEIATSDDAGPDRQLAPDDPLRSDSDIHFFPKLFDLYTYTVGFQRWFRAHAYDYDIIHIHALFSHLPIVAARAARRAGLPYVITPHGMINRYGMAHKAAMKAASFRLFERSVLEQAAVIHMTSTAEERDLTALHIQTPVRKIPLAVDPLPPGKGERFLKDHIELHGCTNLAFVGRINPVKNIEALIDALAILAPRHPALRLIVIGDGDPSYLDALKARAVDHNVGERICWAGHLGGQARSDALTAAQIYVQPSLSESFGMSVVEALSLGLACVVSDKVALAEELAAAGHAIIVPPDSKAIAEAIEACLSAATSNTVKPGREYAKSAFSRKQIAADMVDMYRSATRQRQDEEWENRALPEC